MGTNTVYHGMLDIVPPLTWPEVRRSVSWPGHPDHGNTGWSSIRYGATLVLDEREVDTPDGTLIRRTGDAVEITGEDLRHDEVMRDLRALARLFGATHHFVGALECRHDHPDEPVPFRVRIDGTEVIEERPVLLWPGDGTALANVRTTLHQAGYELSLTEAERLAERVLHNLEDLNRKK